MPKLNINEVEHVANLARLEFSEQDKIKLTEHLVEILDYIDKLNELNTDDVQPTSHVIPVKNVVRPDKVKPSLKKEAALSNAPSNVDNLFEVPKIIE
ncbi:Asp-tRNA(Asn)/Glu-tRNA(Gln) amidotransferase subunit GatC [Candidatus Poribacteria bacterium]|nr:Asp-tRNA(Asn)/Glu-tRNA(Gln) amidotransferase subunit GatC [Candidatus Poribacteria bacterium]